MKVYLFGQRNNLGGGTHFAGRGCHEISAAVGGMIEEVEVSGKKISPVVSQIQPNDVSVFFFPTMSEQFVKGTIIKWGIFETDSLPVDYITYLKRSHLIWVPSQWAKTVLISHGLNSDQIHVVHEELILTLSPIAGQNHLRAIFSAFSCGKKHTRVLMSY